MDSEKDLLKQDLAKQEKQEEIRQFIEDTELMGGNEDIVELAKAKLEAINKKVENITPEVENTESQKTQVDTIGGSENGLQEVTTSIDEKITQKDEEIKNIELEINEKITEIGGENQDKNKNRLAQLENLKQHPQLNVEELKSKITAVREEMAEALVNSPNLLQNYEKVKLYQSLGRIEEANKIIEFIAKDYEHSSLSDQGSGYHAGLAAEKYADLGNTAKAKEMWEKSINQIKLGSEPKDAGNYFDVANKYIKLGNTEKANEMFKKCVDLNEKAIGANKSYSRAALAYEKLGDTAKAKEMWEKEASDWGEGAKAERAGECYEKAGNKDKANEMYRKAIVYQEDLKNRKGFTFDQERLAKAYIGIGEKSKALQMLKEDADEMEKKNAILGVYRNYELIDKYLS